MRTQKTISWAFAGLFSLFGVLGIGQADANSAETAGGAHASVEVKLDNATCLTCHEESKKGDAKASASKDSASKDSKDGSHPALAGISNDKYGKSVHGEMQCIACHKEITDAVAQHKLGTAAKPDCITCHQALWVTVQKDNLTKEKARLGIVVKNIESYKNSYHARPNKEDKTHANAVCDDCHNTHTFSVPPQGTTKRTEWHLTIPNVCGSKCHSDELDEYSGSVHGKKVLEEKNLKAAVCIDCHTSHNIFNTSKDEFKTSIAENCGNCHAANLKSYRSTYHGQVNKLGYGYTAKCYDCHGSHGILSPSDPASTVNPKNRLKTCQKCHKQATAGYLTFSPHANSGNYERYPQVWIVTRFMLLLLVGVFTFFWLHTGLWWYREAKERSARKRHLERRKKTT